MEATRLAGIPRNGAYRVVDENGRPKDEFQLGADAVTVEVKPRSLLVDLLGAGLGLGSLGVAAGGSALESPALVVAGVAGVVGATVIAVWNGSGSSVTVKRGTNFTKATPASALVLRASGLALEF